MDSPRETNVWSLRSERDRLFRETVAFEAHFDGGPQHRGDNLPATQADVRNRELLLIKATLKYQKAFNNLVISLRGTIRYE